MYEQLLNSVLETKSVKSGWGTSLIVMYEQLLNSCFETKLFKLIVPSVISILSNLLSTYCIVAYVDVSIVGTSPIVMYPQLLNSFLETYVDKSWCSVK